MFSDLTSPHFWQTFGITTAKVIAIAFAFELIVLVVNYQFSRLMGPALAADAGRDPAWRIKRRERLRRTMRGLVRGVLYTLGMLVILEVFKTPATTWTVPLYVALGVLALLGAGTGILRDMAAGYALLLEDALAPGDEIEAAGLSGTVESVGWRSIRLRPETGEVHTVANRLLGEFTVTSPAKSAPGAGEDREAPPKSVANREARPRKGSSA